MAAYVWRDGQRLTAWMLYQINRAAAAFFLAFAVRLLVSSGIRTYAEQEAIFLSRYVVAAHVNGRRVYDTRWWKGVLWYRISPAGTVAQPGTSNHEIQGAQAAADFRDSGQDAGVTVAGTARSNWLRANASKYDMIPSGFRFREPWHYDIRNIFKTPPSSGDGSASKGITVINYHREDKDSRSKGRTLKAGGSFYLHTTAGMATSKAANIVGGIGMYQFVLHVYAEGTPGDTLDVVLLWDDTKTSGAHSAHYTQTLTFDRDGKIRANFPYARAVAAGYAVYARMTASAKNKGSAKVTVFDSDATLFA